MVFGLIFDFDYECNKVFAYQIKKKAFFDPGDIKNSSVVRTF